MKDQNGNPIELRVESAERPLDEHDHEPDKEPSTVDRVRDAKRRRVLKMQAQRRHEEVHERMMAMLTDEVEHAIEAVVAFRAGLPDGSEWSPMSQHVLSLFSTFANVRSSGSHAAVAKDAAGDSLGSVVAGGMMAALLGGALSSSEGK